MAEFDYRLVLDALADAVVAADQTGHIAYGNRAAERLLGYAPGELLGRPLVELLPERLRPAHLRGFDRFLTTQRPRIMGRPVRLAALRQDGAELDVELTLSAFRLPDGSDLIVGLLRDLRDRVELERLLAVTRYLAAANRGAADLAAASSPEQALAAVTATLAGELDVGLAEIWLRAAEGERLRLTVFDGLVRGGSAGAEVELALAESPHLVARAARARQAVVATELPGDTLLDPDWVARERLVAVSVQPLLAGSELLGVLACFFRRPIEQELREVLAAFAQAVAAWLQKADLLARNQAARREAEEAVERARRLQALTEAALGDLPVDQLLRELLGQLRDLLGVDTGSILLLTPDRRVLRLRAAIGYQADDLSIPVGRGLAGRIAAEDRAAAEERGADELLGPIAGGQEIRAVAGAPLRAEHGVMGVLRVGTVRPRTFGPQELKFLQLVADRIALAIDRARLLEAERAGRAQAEEARLRSGFLAEASALLAGSLDYRITLVSMAQLCATRLCDYCLVDALEQDGTLRPWVVAHLDPDRAEALRALGLRLSPSSEQPRALAEVLRTGRSRLFAELTEEVLRGLARDGEHLEALRALALQAVILAPLRARGRNLGVLTLLDTALRRWGPADLGMADDLAARAAAAIDNAMLYGQAQEAVRVRDEFLSVASHELKTPLTSLRLQIQSVRLAARKNPVEAVPERALAKIEMAERQVDRLTRLIDELLDLSRIAGGRLQLDWEEIDLARLGHEVAARLGEEAVRAGSAITLRAPSPVVGRWDRLRVDQVLTNLLTNAIKYGAGRPVEVAVDEADGIARLVVRDHGIGIGPEHVGRIFDRFERAVSARHYGGLGLGLYIVGQIVEALGGTVSVESAPAQGSTFTVRLPTAQGPGRSSPGPTGSAKG